MHSPARHFPARLLEKFFSVASWLELASREAQSAPSAARAPHATYITDADWKITHVSAGFTLLTGLAPRQALGRTPPELIGPDDGVYPLPPKVMLGRLRLGSLMRRDGVLRGADGRRLHVRVSDTPLFDEEGRLLNVIGEVERVARD